MNENGYQAIGPDRPMGDREDEEEENWSPEEVERISNEEVKSPQNDNDIDEKAPDDDSEEPHDRR